MSSSADRWRTWTAMAACRSAATEETRAFTRLEGFRLRMALLMSSWLICGSTYALRTNTWPDVSILMYFPCLYGN